MLHAIVQLESSDKLSDQSQNHKHDYQLTAAVMGGLIQYCSHEPMTQFHSVNLSGHYTRCCHTTVIGLDTNQDRTRASDKL